MHARIPGANSLNYSKFTYTLSDSARDELACSSLKIAFDITPLLDTEEYNLNTLSIIPNPAKIFKSSDPIFIYYEIYNLIIDTSSRTRYSLDFTLRSVKRRKNLLQSVAGLFKGKSGQRITTHIDQVGTSRKVTDFIQLDVSKVKPGKYFLMLTVTDNVLNKETQSSSEIEII